MSAHNSIEKAADWYPFLPSNNIEQGEIGLDDFIEKPAAKHGRITREGSRLIYNGKPIQLWGINLCFRNCAPEKSLADRRAALYSKFGFNSVRLHKFADGRGHTGVLSKESSAEYDPVSLDRMDYQIARFREVGIYIKLSAHFGTVSVTRKDMESIPVVADFGGIPEGQDRVAVPHSAIFYSRAIQDHHNRQMVNLLNHRNPYTGLTYAEDPAIYLIEIVNEQSILFWTGMGPLEKSITLRREVGRRFCDWLKVRYGDETGLMEAWGSEALNTVRREVFTEDENLDSGTILPLGNQWHWDPDQINGQEQAHLRQRMLDTLEFLTMLQEETYTRFIEAVRATGYPGEFIGSNWQAGRAYSHYANLHTDYEVGTIDRHNYFGGGRDALKGKPFRNGSMLETAGSGILSTGLQQVVDRPFMLSEWIHVFPNERGAEGPAIIGAYGMGLQGWDVSYLFQNGDAGGFRNKIGGERWDVTAPQVLGVLPAVARQVLRGDVKESGSLAVRKVHFPSLFEGKLSFDDVIKQGYDDKELNSSAVPRRALAAVRCVVEFTDQYEQTDSFDLRSYLNDGQVISSTGQLTWQDNPAEEDYFFTINSAGTKAVVGFAKGDTFDLDGTTLQPQSHFSALYVTAQEPAGTIEKSQKLIIVVMARARNTGMKFNEKEDILLETGEAPVLLEPVKATITLNRPENFKVILLNHDGQRTGNTIPVKDGRFTIDGVADKTPYYLVEFE